jgi:hypothetical protein
MHLFCILAVLGLSTSISGEQVLGIDYPTSDTSSWSFLASQNSCNSENFVEINNNSPYQVQKNWLNTSSPTSMKLDFTIWGYNQGLSSLSINVTVNEFSNTYFIKSGQSNVQYYACGSSGSLRATQSIVMTLNNPSQFNVKI